MSEAETAVATETVEVVDVSVTTPGLNTSEPSQPHQPPQPTRYIKGVRAASERIPAGGGFTEDWIECKHPTLSMFELVLMSRGDDLNNRMMRIRLAHLMISDWSFIDQNGNKLPITYNEIADGDAEMARALEPVIDRAGDFLARRLLIGQS